MPRWLVPVVVAAVALPPLGAAVAQAGARWHPVFDLAMTELRVRDVGGAHTPLIGLQGRIGPTGSHPGPLSFYLLAPVYRLFGSSAWALQLSTAVFHAAGAAIAILVAARRPDGRLVVGVGIILALLMQGYGLGPLTEPWNPHLPVLWFVAFLISAWAVADGDLPMLVPAVLSASVCAQTHVPYLAVTVGLGLGLAVAALAWLRARGGRSSPDLRWVLVALGVGLVAWLPPLIDEVVNEPGNMSQIVEHLGSPTEDVVGVRPATSFVLERLDGWQLVVGETIHPGTYVRPLSGPGPDRGRGLVTVLIWTFSVALAVRMRHRGLLALHGVIAVSVLVAVAAISRVFGIPWPYLMFWVFGIGALMVLSIAATGSVLLTRALSANTGTPRWLGVAGLVALLALSARLLVLSGGTTTATPEETARLARLVPPTVAALEDRVGPASGHEGRYLLRWADVTHGGSTGIGMVNELIRRGYDVGVEDAHRVLIGPHRVLTRQEATAEIVLASGRWIERTAARAGAVRVAFDDPRSEAERADFVTTRSAAIDALHRAGRGDLVERVDSDLFGLALNEVLPPEVAVHLGRLIDIGVPGAVFVLPAGPDA